MDPRPSADGEATTRETHQLLGRVARLVTPYAKGRGLKKPRGHRAKARQARTWALVHRAREIGDEEGCHG